MQDFEKRGGIIALVGLALVLLGEFLQFTRLGLLGLAILGVGVIFWGVSGVIEGRMIFFHPGVRYSESYYGFAARVWGVLICMAGAALVGFSFLLFFKPDLSFEQAFTSPLGMSIGMLLFGVIGMLYATTLILGRAEDSSSRLRKVISLPGRILGLFVLLVSMGLTVASVARMVAPQIYERVVQSISDHLPRAPQLDND
jgi:hypothetical protein